MLAARDYTGIRAYIVTLGSIPEILCSGAIYPEVDFAGRPLQDLSDHSNRLELVTFSLIATERGGALVFAWHTSGDAVCRPLAASLDRLTDDELPHAIVRFVLEFCENHYFNPEWWDGADQKIKDALTDRFQISASVWEARSKTCLSEDGLRATAWRVAGRAWL